MRPNPVRSTRLLVLACLFTFAACPIFAQESDPLDIGVPVSIVRKIKPTRQPPSKGAKPVEKAPLLKLEWRLYKVLADGSEEEAAPESFERGDRLRLSVRTNQEGYLYVIHQKSPAARGEVIFPDSRLNNGSSLVYKTEEFVLPSNCPVKISRRDCALILTSSGDAEVFHLLFSRDPFKELPDSASDATGDISPELLQKLNDDSGQILKRQRGSTPFSNLLVNINTRDNEDIIEKLVLEKKP